LQCGVQKLRKKTQQRATISHHKTLSWKKLVESRRGASKPASNSPQCVVGVRWVNSSPHSHTHSLPHTHTYSLCECQRIRGNLYSTWSTKALDSISPLTQRERKSLTERKRERVRVWV